MNSVIRSEEFQRSLSSIKKDIQSLVISPVNLSFMNSEWNGYNCKITFSASGSALKSVFDDPEAICLPSGNIGNYEFGMTSFSTEENGIIIDVEMIQVDDFEVEITLSIPNEELKEYNAKVSDFRNLL